MAKRSNTAAVRAMPMSDSSTYSSEETSIRKIDNGYVTRKSSSGPLGYSSSESFSPNPPSGGGPAHGPGETSGSLADAISTLKGEKR